MTRTISNWWQAALLAVVVATPSASALETDRAGADVRALVKLGPRVAGTKVMDLASTYLIEEYRKAGYVTEIQTFTYPRFEDLGSNIVVGATIEGQALNGSPPGKLAAPLVAVPNVGRASDFASVDVKGAIAIVQRGKIRFLEKAENAAAAGAVGLVLVNTERGNLSGGTLGGEAKIPVLALSGERGGSLLERARSLQLKASLNVNTRSSIITGRNVVAHLKGVTQPSVLLGGHYDSVPGAPGANDNASGTAVVLNIARNLSGTSLARQAWFVAFDGEEDGLHGSRAFVSVAKPQFLSGLKAMLNFDMVGVNDNLRVGGTSSLTTLTKAVDRSVSTFQAYGGSDHAPFANAGVPVLFFYRGQEPNYHTPNDKQVDPKLLDETVRVGLDVVKQLLMSES